MQLDVALGILARTPGALTELLTAMPRARYSGNEGEATWSAFGVVRHLISADETSWLPRARRIREEGDARPFEPPDPLGAESRFAGLSIESLLELFAGVRAAGLREVRGWNLGEADLARRGLHPQLGTVTLGELFATWAVHDYNHIAQIARVLAWQLKDDVGAWREFLAILDR